MTERDATGQREYHGSRPLGSLADGLEQETCVRLLEFQMAHGSKEAQDLIGSFSGISWWEADDSLIDVNYDKLPRFTDAAFHYYFPAYLMGCVNNFSSENLVLEFLIYSLEPKHYIDADHYQARFVLFSSRERNAFSNFLKESYPPNQ